MIDITHVTGPIKIFLSAGPYAREGFVSTQQDQLDLLKRRDWEESFGQRKITAILAEHVWEHLTVEDGIAGAKMCFDYLEPGGLLRVGVPDGLFPDVSYQEKVAINGPGTAADHKALYTYRTLPSVFQAAGFETTLLEYWDESGKFHFIDWSAAKGIIYRSRRFDARNQSGKLAFTSLIIDAVKPA